MKTEFFFHSDNAAGRVILSYDRPVLMGSAKQVTWAEEIRSQFERQFALAILKLAGFPKGEGVWLKTDDLSDVAVAIEAAMQRQFAGKSFADHIALLLSTDDVRFFIDNRITPAMVLLERQAKA